MVEKKTIFVSLFFHIDATIHATMCTYIQLPYKINTATSDPLALSRPSLNISKSGNIPIKMETFSIAMRCTGARSIEEVVATISLEVTLKHFTNNFTELVLKWKKNCSER